VGGRGWLSAFGGSGRGGRYDGEVFGGEGEAGWTGIHSLRGFE
jgi:hypothetical protein